MRNVVGKFNWTVGKSDFACSIPYRHRIKYTKGEDEIILMSKFF